MDIKLIKEKEEKLRECAKILKKEFIGIDKVIDQVMDNIKTWYIYPELITRPVVINLWGMTGCGKTSLVLRICEILGLGDKIYYNLAKITEDTSFEMEDIFERVIPLEANPVFIFDEFQFAASISSDHKEKEPITALKTIWEIIDTGKIQKECPAYLKNKLDNIILCFSILGRYGAKIENGVWKNSKSCFNKMTTDTKSRILDLFNVTFELPPMYADFKATRYWCEELHVSLVNDQNFFMNCNAVGPIIEAAKLIGLTKMGAYEFYSKVIQKMSFAELYEFIEDILKKLKQGILTDYSHSIVFVMGNIDEAYKISYNMDPDMDPDQFHSMTENLSIVDVKEALQERFRNEQIARLGSIMIMYPSFSKNDFERIIGLQLEKCSKNVKDLLGIQLDFEQTINDVIYKDGVFPAQGTRPVFTSVYEIVQNKIAPMMIECIDNNHYDVDKIVMSFCNGRICFKAYKNGEFLFESSFEQVLRVESLRNDVDKEQQLLTAVHESGHFVMYSKLTGKLPAKLVSSTATHSANGFMLEDYEEYSNYMTRQDYLDSIMIDLGGYVAETLVFGSDNITSGASLDLRNATTTASKMIREYGMGNGVISVSTYLDDCMGTDDGMLMKDTQEQHANINKMITSILDECKQNVLDTLSSIEWNDMFKMSCMYLKDNTCMSEETMEEIYCSVSETHRKKSARKKDRFEKLFDKFIN